MSFKGSKVQKVMVQPINLIFRYLQNRSRVQVWLYENTHLRIEGHIGKRESRDGGLAHNLAWVCVNTAQWKIIATLQCFIFSWFRRVYESGARRGGRV